MADVPKIAWMAGFILIESELKFAGSVLPELKGW